MMLDRLIVHEHLDAERLDRVQSHVNRIECWCGYAADLEGAQQVGWAGPYGLIPGGMDNDPAPHWQPVYGV